MLFLTDLWLPIVVSALAVFIMSALFWTVLPNHKKEFGELPNEDAVMGALDASGVPAGRYVVPWSDDGKRLGTPEGKAKFERGPIAFITIAPRGMPNMGRMLVLSLLSSVLISTCVAYLAWHSLPKGVPYLVVFRITGTATFMAYALGFLSEAIWFARPWKSIGLNAFDALVYGLLTGGIFGWLMPT